MYAIWDTDNTHTHTYDIKYSKYKKNDIFGRGDIPSYTLSRKSYESIKY